VNNAVFGNHQRDSLIREFLYPRFGPGMMWERFRDLVQEGGGEVRMRTPVDRVEVDGGEVRAVVTGGDDPRRIECAQLISSMPVNSLVARLRPGAPPTVAAAAGQLRHRALVVVGLLVGRAEVFPDQWIYVHDSEVRVGRIQNFRNWSREMCADPNSSNLGLEYFCDVNDEIWSRPDDALVELATLELERLGLVEAGDVQDGVVFRQPGAYPMYDDGYLEKLAVIWRYLDGISNLQSVGRNGRHRYNNQDHSMLTGILAARNLDGELHDLAAVHSTQSHVEAVRLADGDKSRTAAGAP
jgi:protoporphyrinogen oxidase